MTIEEVPSTLKAVKHAGRPIEVAGEAHEILRAVRLQRLANRWIEVDGGRTVQRILFSFPRTLYRDDFLIHTAIQFRSGPELLYEITAQQLSDPTTVFPDVEDRALFILHDIDELEPDTALSVLLNRFDQMHEQGLVIASCTDSQYLPWTVAKLFDVKIGLDLCTVSEGDCERWWRNRMNYIASDKELPPETADPLRELPERLKDVLPIQLEDYSDAIVTALGMEKSDELPADESGINHLMSRAFRIWQSTRFANN